MANIHDIDQLQLSGILLAGGQSRRMKSEKSFVLFKNKPLISHSLNTLKSVCDEIIISANNNHFEQLGYPVVPDKESFGPISGIISCLPQITNNFAFITPTDTPYISIDLIRHLFEQRDEGKITVAFNSNGQMEPLCVVFPKSTIKSLNEIANSGVRKIITVIERLGYKRVDITSDLDFYQNNLFFNVNRPADLL